MQKNKFQDFQNYMQKNGYEEQCSLKRNELLVKWRIQQGALWQKEQCEQRLKEEQLLKEQLLKKQE